MHEVFQGVDGRVVIRNLAAKTWSRTPLWEKESEGQHPRPQVRLQLAEGRPLLFRCGLEWDCDVTYLSMRGNFD